MSISEVNDVTEELPKEFKEHDVTEVLPKELAKPCQIPEYLV